MISRPTSSIPKEDVVFPRLLYCVLRCSQTCRRCSQTCLPCSQVHSMISPALRGVPNPITITPMVLLDQSSEIPVTLKATRNTLLGCNILSWNWRIYVYTPHSLRHTARLPVTKIDFPHGELDLWVDWKWLVGIPTELSFVTAEYIPCLCEQARF